jgi:hypothetical protein
MPKKIADYQLKNYARHVENKKEAVPFDTAS